MTVTDSLNGRVTHTLKITECESKIVIYLKIFKIIFKINFHFMHMSVLPTITTRMLGVTRGQKNPRKPEL